MKHSLLKRLVCTALAALTMLTVAAVPAMAANVSLPDTTSARSLTIYKYTTASDYTTGGEGHKQTVTDTHQPMENVIFDIYKYAELGADVPASITATDAASWVKANSTKLVTSVITDSAGSATWNAGKGKANDAVYLVVERDNAAVNTAENPFFVSLPYTDTEENQWIYKVVVQPKNTLVPGPTVNKDVTSIDNKHDSDMIGEDQTWIIRGTIPEDLYTTTSLNTKTIEVYAKNYKFTDVIDSELTFSGLDTVKVVVYTGVQEETLDGTKYTVNFDSAKNTLTVSLTQAGMKAVKNTIVDADKAEIRVYFNTSIKSTATMGREIPNNVTLDYTNSAGIVYDPTEVPEDDRPEVHTGGLHILKTDIASSTKVLAGATYQIATSEANALAGTYMKDAEGKYIVLTTGADGKAEYKGLPYDRAKGTAYYLVETKAPDGYQLAKAPIKVTVNATTYSDTAKTYTLTDATKYDLPKAGGHGMMMYIIIGMLVLGGVAFACVATSRKHRKAN